MINDRDDQLVRRPVPDPRLGDARLRRRPRRGLRGALAAALARPAARRARSRRGLGGAPRRPPRREPPRSTASRFDRARARRARHGADARATPARRRWHAGESTTAAGLRHLPNLPTEEVFTTPDPLQADGHVTATRPLVLKDGTVVRGLRVAFEAGRAVEIDADENGEALRHVARRRRRRHPARRGRARRPPRPDRAARDDLLRHPPRRERRQSPRARVGLRVPRRRGRCRADQPEPGPSSTSWSARTSSR